MSFITLKAHYDGKQILLDEPFNLAPNTPVLVTIQPDPAEEAEREEWFAFAKAAFARAYGDDEPDYSDAVLREHPPK